LKKLTVILKKYDDGEYIGEFKNGLREGKGTFYYNEKNKYERMME